MGQIISWSVRDETLHCLSIIKLFRTFVEENPDVWTGKLGAQIYQDCATIVGHEDPFSIWHSSRGRRKNSRRM
jgi:ribonucleoside-diphosphate reductase beta chain